MVDGIIFIQTIFYGGHNAFLTLIYFLRKKKKLSIEAGYFIPAIIGGYN